MPVRNARPAGSAAANESTNAIQGASGTNEKWKNRREEREEALPQCLRCRGKDGPHAAGGQGLLAARSREQAPWWEGARRGHRTLHDPRACARDHATREEHPFVGQRARGPVGQRARGPGETRGDPQMCARERLARAAHSRRALHAHRARVFELDRIGARRARVAATCESRSRMWLLLKPTCGRNRCGIQLPFNGEHPGARAHPGLSPAPSGPHCRAPGCCHSTDAVPW